MFLDRQIDPPENPVLLHELLHAYHQQRLPDGLKNPRIIAFFEAASLSGKFPPQAYMLTNPAEFFAMCASVVLWGHAARLPFTRAHVRETPAHFLRLDRRAIHAGRSTLNAPSERLSS